MKNFSPEQFERKFAQYGCRKMTDVADVAGIEFWVTGWNEHFTVCRTKDGLYNGEDCVAAMVMIARTAPIEWRLKVAIENLTVEIQLLRSDLSKEKQSPSSRRKWRLADPRTHEHAISGQCSRP
jgi:hypothetical protein